MASCVRVSIVLLLRCAFRNQFLAKNHYSPCIVTPLTTCSQLLSPLSCSTLYMLVLVQELVSYANGTFESPSRPLSSFSLEQLLRSTADFKTQRSRRQTLSNGAVYIAANLSMGQEKDPFQLGDGMEYGGFTNYPLKPGVFYEVGLRGGVNGTNSTIFTAVEQTFSKWRKHLNINVL